MCSPPLNILFKNILTMKKKMMALASALMMLSCTSDEPQNEQPTGWESKTITFTFGDVLTQHAMTRADITSLDLTDLWMFDYIGEELQQTVHQSNTDQGFGVLSASMGYGEHTLYFVASSHCHRVAIVGILAGGFAQSRRHTAQDNRQR